MIEPELGLGLCPSSVFLSHYHISLSLSVHAQGISRWDNEKWFFINFSSEETLRMKFMSLKGLFYPEVLQFSSVQFSRSVMSDSLRPYELQHARPPCPSPTPGVYSNSCLSSQWYHPVISSSVIPSPPAPNPSQHQGLFQWVNSSHEVAKVLELQHQSFQWTPRIDLLQDGLVGSPCRPRDSQESSPTLWSKASIFQHSAFITVQLSYPYMATGKTITLTRWTFVGKVMSLLFNTLSRLVITFLPRSKCLLISWLKSPSAVILEPRKVKSDTVSTVSPSICHEVMGPDAMILFSECWALGQLFHSPLSLSSRGFLVPLHFLP